jgi:predicted nucleic acid-binding protein
MTLTFVDAGVLIAAARGNQAVSDAALAVLIDPDREFAASLYLRLEVMPKPLFHRRSAEVAFYERFFLAVSHWIDTSGELVERAYREACAAGLGALDALHLVAAIDAGATEFITTEKRTTLANRVTSITVVTIRSEDES